MRIVQIVLTMFLCFMLACDNRNSSAEIPSKNDKILANDNYNPLKTTISPLDSLVRLLQKDNFDLNIDTSINKTVVFVAYKMSFTESKQDTFKFQTQKVVSISAKRRNKINNTDLFPRLTIQQMTFDSPINADKAQKIIEKIIFNPDDIFNDKLYDRIRILDNKIFYLETQTKAFESFVIHYDKELEKIINAR